MNTAVTRLAVSGLRLRLRTLRAGLLSRVRWPRRVPWLWTGLLVAGTQIRLLYHLRRRRSTVLTRRMRLSVVLRWER